jgi:gliding motility-associated lipoprotein GldB
MLFASCNKSKRFEIDATKNRINVNIHRFDKDLLSLDTTNIKSGVKRLYKNYPDFLPFYTNEILDTAATDTAAVQNLFFKYLTDTAFSKVNKKTMETFVDISDIEKHVSTAFTYIHYYFPEVKLPEVYFYVSGFNRSIMMNNKFIGIGTDFYLGSDYPAYKGLTYEYMVQNMRRECLATDLVSAALFRMFRMNSTENRLIDNMLFRGKVLYLMSVFMPDEKPEGIIGYSVGQLKWCKTNEKQIWGTMIDQKHLFSTDMLLIRKYLNDAPFTSTISQESPGRLGTWVGLQIVQSYMQKNTKVTLRELMDENNYQKILENSDYKP